LPSIADLAAAVPGRSSRAGERPGGGHAAAAQEPAPIRSDRLNSAPNPTGEATWSRVQAGRIAGVGLGEGGGRGRKGDMASDTDDPQN